jgi:flagellar motor protein MotB
MGLGCVLAERWPLNKFARTQFLARRLSNKRSAVTGHAVIQYLVLKHGLDLRRLVQPFGYGENNPVADDKTSEGRQDLSRRVKIPPEQGIVSE